MSKAFYVSLPSGRGNIKILFVFKWLHCIIIQSGVYFKSRGNYKKISLAGNRLDRDPLFRLYCACICILGVS